MSFSHANEASAWNQSEYENMPQPPPLRLMQAGTAQGLWDRQLGVWCKRTGGPQTGPLYRYIREDAVVVIVSA